MEMGPEISHWIFSADAAVGMGRLIDAREYAMLALDAAQDRASHVAAHCAVSRALRHSSSHVLNSQAVAHALEAQALVFDFDIETRHATTLELASAHAVLADRDSVIDLVEPLLHDPPMGWAAGRAWFLVGTVRDQEANYPAALAAYQRSLAAFGADPALDREIAVARGAVAGVLDRLGQTRVAEEMYAEAGEYWSTVAAKDRRGWAIWLLNRAIVRKHLGHYVDAMEDAERAAAEFGLMQDMDHARAAALGNYANIAVVMGQQDKARRYADRAVNCLMRPDGRGTDHPRRLADLLSTLGNCLADEQNFAAARQCYDLALKIIEASDLDRSRYQILKDLLRLEPEGPGQKVTSDDLAAYSEAVRVLEDNPAGSQHDEAVARVNYGLLSGLVSDHADDPMTPILRAERNLRLALERFRALEGTERAQARCQIHLARTLAQQGRYPEALVYAVAGALFLDSDRFTIKQHDQREIWSAMVVHPALHLALALAAICGDDEQLSDLVILSRASGVRLSQTHYQDPDWNPGDLPLGPLPRLAHPSDPDRVINAASAPGEGSTFFF